MQEAELPGVISIGLQSSIVSMFSLKSITVNLTNGSTTVWFPKLETTTDTLSFP